MADWQLDIDENALFQIQTVEIEGVVHHVKLDTACIAHCLLLINDTLQDLEKSVENIDEAVCKKKIQDPT